MFDEKLINSVTEAALKWVEDGGAGKYVLENFRLEHLFDVRDLIEKLEQQEGFLIFDDDNTVTEWWLNNFDVYDHIDEDLVISAYFENNNMWEVYSDAEIVECALDRSEEHIIKWVVENNSVGAVYPEKELREWALANGFVEKEE